MPYSLSKGRVGAMLTDTNANVILCMVTYFTVMLLWYVYVGLGVMRNEFAGAVNVGQVTTETCITRKHFYKGLENRWGKQL